MNTTILLVTWIVAGQAPSSYQVNFASAQACEIARAAIKEDAVRVSNELLLPHSVPAPPVGFKVDADHGPLAVSAVCAATSN